MTSMTAVLVVAATFQAAPSGRAHHALTYDEASRRVILTGGSTPLDGAAGDCTLTEEP